MSLSAPLTQPSPVSLSELERIFAPGSAYQLVPLLDGGAVMPLRMANGYEADGAIWWGAEFAHEGELHILCTGPYGYELFEALDAQSLDRLCEHAGGEVFTFSAPAAASSPVALIADRTDWRSLQSAS